jgi:hypothetical protein
LLGESASLDNLFVQLSTLHAGLLSLLKREHIQFHHNEQIFGCVEHGVHFHNVRVVDFGENIDFVSQRFFSLNHFFVYDFDGNPLACRLINAHFNFGEVPPFESLKRRNLVSVLAKYLIGHCIIISEKVVNVRSLHGAHQPNVVFYPCACPLCAPIPAVPGVPEGLARRGVTLLHAFTAKKLRLLTSLQ